MQLAFHCAGIEVAVEIAGSDPGLLGYYEFYPSQGGEPNLLIEVNGIADWPDPEPGFDPVFEVVSISAARLELRRADAEGAFTWQPTGNLIGRFRTAARPSGLEAIIRIGMSLLLPERNALLFHSSCVAAGPRGFVFSGVSGAGKSTISDLLATDSSLTKVADELLIIQKNSDSYRVLVAPFAGYKGLPHNTSVILDSIHFLYQAAEHRRLAVQPRDAMPDLCRHIVNFVKSPAIMTKVLNLTADLVEAIPCYQLYFAKDASVRDVLGITCADTGA